MTAKAGVMWYTALYLPKGVPEHKPKDTSLGNVRLVNVATSKCGVLIIDLY